MLDRLPGVRVLFLNWRDTGHPEAGGAEVYCEQIAERFASAGADVTLFTAAYPGASMAEITRGVRVVREGGRLGVYAAAARHLRRHQQDYDAVVDLQNGIPFFSPLFVRRRLATVCVVHHVHQNQFDLVFPYPQNVVGKVLEKQVSRAVYGERPIVVVSPSTRSEVRRVLGFRGPIHMVPNGILPLGTPAAPKSAAPSIAVVTRLVPQKRIDLLVRLVPDLVRRWPDLTLEVAGSGPELEPLRRLAAELGVTEHVHLPGFVSEERKNELLVRAWLTVVPSEAEGWGLTVIEAASAGTPSVAFDVPGLRDSILDGRTGWLVHEGGDLLVTVEQALQHLSDAGKRALMSEQCTDWAASFSWDFSAERLAGVVLGEMQRVRRGSRSRRRSGDVATVVRIRTDDVAEVEARLRTSVRLTDLRRAVDGRIELLLHDCDEVEAEQLLQRVGVLDAEVSVARRNDILTGLRAGG